MRAFFQIYSKRFGQLGRLPNKLWGVWAIFGSTSNFSNMKDIFNLGWVMMMLALKNWESRHHASVVRDFFHGFFDYATILAPYIDCLLALFRAVFELPF